MKAVKITLLVALFLSVSSQAVKITTNDSEKTHKTTTHDDLLAHKRSKEVVPSHA